MGACEKENESMCERGRKRLLKCYGEELVDYMCYGEELVDYIRNFATSAHKCYGEEQSNVYGEECEMSHDSRVL